MHTRINIYRHYVLLSAGHSSPLLSALAPPVTPLQGKDHENSNCQRVSRGLSFRRRQSLQWYLENVKLFTWLMKPAGVQLISRGFHQS